MTQNPHPILEEIRAACAERDLPPTKFGLLAIGDPNLVSEIEQRGREPRRRTIAAIRHFIRTGERLDQPVTAPAGDPD